jgi:hypothetical protein
MFDLRVEPRFLETVAMIEGMPLRLRPGIEPGTHALTRLFGELDPKLPVDARNALGGITHKLPARVGLSTDSACGAGNHSYIPLETKLVRKDYSPEATTAGWAHAGMVGAGSWTRPSRL